MQVEDIVDNTVNDMADAMTDAMTDDTSSEVKTALDAITSLEVKIKDYAKLYYENEPAISDAEFDQLVEDLKKLSPSSSLLTTPGWGYKPEGRQLVKHLSPLYTIDDKLKTYDGAIKRIGRFSKIQPKYDGASATLYYRDGKLLHALTRGDGVYGYDIKDKINLEGLVDSEIDGVSVKGIVRSGDVDVRVEVAMSLDDWNEYYDTNENPSPRNLITGIIGKENPSELEISIAKPIILDVTIIPNDKVFAEIDLTINDKIVKAQTLDVLPEKLPITPYLTDGCVIKTYKDSGYVDIVDIYAYKPTSEIAETTVKNIIWQKGRTGKYTPVLAITPVKISGATVSRVTGNSIEMLEADKYGVGAKIRVFRSGEVIPCIHSVIEPSNIFLIPNESERVGAHLYSTTFKYNAYEKIVAMMSSNTKHFGKSLVDKILGIFEFPEAESVVNFLTNIDMSNDVYTDYFTKHELELLQIAVKKLSRLTLNQFLAGLEIPNMSKSTIDKFLNNQTIPKHAEESWKKYGSDIDKLVAAIKDSEFNNLIPEFTGSISKTDVKGLVAVTGKHGAGLTREVMQKQIEDKGYGFQANVNSNTNFLIIADVNSTSAKAKAARKIGIKLLSSIAELP